MSCTMTEPSEARGQLVASPSRASAESACAMVASLPFLIDDSTYVRMIRTHPSASLTSLSLMEAWTAGAGG